MFYQVKIYKADGTLKETVSTNQLSDKHWKTFEKMESEISLNSTGMKPVPGWVKQKLDLQFPSNLELDYQSSQS
jgi:hypothetical protein